MKNAIDEFTGDSLQCRRVAPRIMMLSAGLPGLDDDTVGAVLAFTGGFECGAVASASRGLRAAVDALSDGHYENLVRASFGGDVADRASAGSGPFSWRGLCASLGGRVCDCCGGALAFRHPLRVRADAADDGLFDAVRRRAAVAFSDRDRWMHRALQHVPERRSCAEAWCARRGVCMLHVVHDLSKATIPKPYHEDVVGAVGTFRWVSQVDTTSGPWRLSLALTPSSSRRGTAAAGALDAWLARFTRSPPGHVGIRIGSFYAAQDALDAVTVADFYPMGQKGRRIAPLDELRLYARNAASFRATAAARLAELRYRCEENAAESVVYARIDDAASAAGDHAEAFWAALTEALTLCCPDALPG